MEFLYSFDAFNMTSLPHDQNIYADILANTTSILMPPNDGFLVEMMFRPSMLLMGLKSLDSTAGAKPATEAQLDSDVFEMEWFS
jgi:hypothetical protein